MSCELSPSAAAFSTMLSAFIGSVINGLCSGWLIAFITGWISWLSVIRILVGGGYEAYLAIKAGTNFDNTPDTQYHQIPMVGIAQTLGRIANPTPHASAAAAESQTHLVVADVETPAQAAPPPPPNTLPPLFSTPQKQLLKPFHPERTVTLSGWLGWSWGAIYTPVSQTIWLGVHLSPSSHTTGTTQFVRALAIGVSALGLTFDTKARYGAAVGRKWGGWAFALFNAWNAGACLLLGVEAAVLLIHGAAQMESPPIPLVGLYPIGCVIWAAGSWVFLPPVDGGRPSGVVAGLLMGAFAGLFVAAPAFGMWQSAQFDERVGEMMGQDGPEGLSLGEFLGCESASVWAKFAAVMP
ncbi:hypothetical protein E8E13_001627 [Curvularia kusanoi]|uniref:Uncharacterized protein n=1 Tax=Curvularia kusanoi TaxID=90978 RepID=A0A9P4W6P9_CURKU|nr:hypothetical protein E8E13_001627 [Curvularia kusanoi]